MRILVAYAGKTGTTEKCAKKLCKKLTNATAVDLNTQTPDIEKFDAVVVGGAIRMGQLHKKAKDFIRQNTIGLKGKRTAYFICCGSIENATKLFQNNFPKELLDEAVGYECFGGSINVEKQHGFDKFVAKMVTKAAADKKQPSPHISNDNISKLAEEIMN